MLFSYSITFTLQPGVESSSLQLLASSGSQPQPTARTRNPRPSTFNLEQQGAEGAKELMFDLQTSTPLLKSSALHLLACPQSSVISHQPSALSPRPSTLNLELEQQAEGAKEAEGLTESAVALLRAEALRFTVCGSGVWGLGFRFCFEVQGFGFRV